VAKGYAQRYGIDYMEVFALVAKLDTTRLILALAAQYECEIFQRVHSFMENLKKRFLLNNHNGLSKREKKTRFTD